ncbi:Gfo/Idh/MocA family oxidoreductase [Streptosporangium canum]|uniref:Gfo/Idh/MocA family protein n=1 Tax=Streptosporangium canum TaxID=324952 RepID=UPI003422ED0A
MRDQRLLLVGVGARVADVLLPALRTANLPLRVTAVCDPAPTTPDRVTGLISAGLLPAEVATHSSLSTALAADTYDIALIACPHDLHQTVALTLAEADITIWKEKPFALTMSDALQLATHPSARVRVLAHRPHSQLYGIAATLLPTWGRLLGYRIRIARETSDYSHTWRALRERSGGGAILDLGYHAADLIARLAPPAATVYATTMTSPAWRPMVDVEETAHLIVTHEHGLVGTVELSRCQDWADDLELLAEGGRIRINGDKARIYGGHLGGPSHTVTLDAADNPWACMLRYHHDTGSDAQITAVETGIGVRATGIVDAAYASLRSNQAAPVPTAAAPDAERIAS